MRFTETNKLVYSMLTENTGSHILDSGGAYGRHHERNAKKTIEDFENEPEETIIISSWGVEREVSVYHFLGDLFIDDICRAFNKLNTNPDNWNADNDEVYGVSSQAWNSLNTIADVEVTRVWNTYNGDSDLSQTLQGANLIINDEHYVLIQVHGGCDIRGGYTDAKLFWVNDEGMIHEYLQEYKDEDEIMEDLEEGYLTAKDEKGNELTFEQVQELLNTEKV